MCLDFIGSKSTRGEDLKREQRIKRGEEILRQHMLSHISTKRGDESKKAYFIGYMIYRLGNCALGRAYGDDRDHYGKKRLDMSGVLLTGIFRQNFRNFVKKAENNLRDKIKNNKSKSVNLDSIFETNIITNGMKYALATGNWGKNRVGSVLKTYVIFITFKKIKYSLRKDRKNNKTSSIT